MTRYLKTDDLIRINERMTQKWGGLAGVRDYDLLEAAVHRPQNGYYLDLIGEASALCESLLQNHPFIDGNKRAAVVATAVFLRWNGYKLKFVDLEMYSWLMALYNSGQVNKINIENWIRAHAVPSPV